MRVLGIDIGGANTKAVFQDEGGFKESYSYLPIWLEKAKLNLYLNGLKDLYAPDICAVTMTAELCDCFKSKIEGVTYVADICNSIFKNVKFFGYPGIFYSYSQIKKEYKNIGSFNWLALAKILSKKNQDSILVDIGTTTTDIISIINHEPQFFGKSDFERLKHNELLYLGAIRTNVSTVVAYVTLNDENVPIAREYFANMADVYIVLEKISEKDYNSDTPDGCGKSKKDCMSRISRLICSDLDELTEKDILSIANQVYQRHLDILDEAIQFHTKKHNMRFNLIGVGVGKFLVFDLAKRKNYSYIEDSKYNNQMACAQAVANLVKD